MEMFEIDLEHCKIWKIIGAELGIDADKLDAIEKDHMRNSDCLCAMIDSADPAFTHEAMTKVLQSEHVTSAVAGMHVSICIICMHCARS